jgi:hypothetical protein
MHAGGAGRGAERSEHRRELIMESNKYITYICGVVACALGAFYNNDSGVALSVFGATLILNSGIGRN